METSTLVPVEEYLATAWEPDREYVDGELVERNVGEHDHSLIQAIIAGWLRDRRHEYGIRVFTEQRICVDATGQRRRYRIPDVCVMALPYIREPVLTTPPAAVVEILSPEDTVTRLLAKVGDYVAFGIPQIIVVNPEERTVFYAGANGLTQVRDRKPSFESGGTARTIDFNEIFLEMDE